MDSHKFKTFQAGHLMNMVVSPLPYIFWVLYTAGSWLSKREEEILREEKKLFCESAIKEHEEREKSQVSLGAPWPHLVLIYKGENISKESWEFPQLSRNDTGEGQAQCRECLWPDKSCAESQIKVTFLIQLSSSLGVWQPCYVFHMKGGDSPHLLHSGCSLLADNLSCLGEIVLSLEGQSIFLC